MQRGLRRRNHGAAKIDSLTSFSQLGCLGEDDLMRELLSQQGSKWWVRYQEHSDRVIS